MKNKKIFVVLLAASVAVFFLAAVFPVSAAGRKINLKKAVIVEISGTIITATKNNRTYTINAERAILQNAKKKRATIDQYFVDDQIDVKGTRNNDNTITARTIKDRSLKPGDLSRRSVGSENIKNDAISDLTFISNDFITSEKIKDETITNADIASNTISGTKLASDINITTTGNISASNLTISGDIGSLTGTITTLDGTTLTYTSGAITSITGTTATYSTGNLNTLDLGTNTLTDGNFAGNWNFNSGVISGISSLSAGAATLLGDLDLGLNQLKNFVLEKLASWPSSPVEGQMFWHTGKDGPYWYTGSRWKSDVSGETFVVAASDSENPEKADYVCDGTGDQTEIQAALDALPTGGGKIVLMEGTYNLTAMITMPASSELAGIGWGTVLNSSGINPGGGDYPAGGAVITMGEYSLLRDIKVQGDISPLTAIGRQIIAGNHSNITHIWINENDGGIETANKTDVHIRDVYFTQIHDSYGWASIIHADNGTSGIFVDGVYGENCDRGFEVENGAKNFYAKHGRLKTIKVPGSYSMVLDAHTHEGLGGVENVVYENFYLEDTVGIAATGASSGITKNVTYRNITMVNPVPDTGTCALLSASSENITFDGIRITGIDFSCVMGAGGDKILLNNIDVVNAQQSGLLSSGGENIILQNSRFKSSSGYALNLVLGENVTLRNNKFYDCTSNGCLQANTGVTYLTVENCWMEMSSGSPGSYGITTNSGAPGLKILNNRILGSPTTAAISIGSSGDNAVVSGNYVTSAAIGIWVRSGVSGVKISENEIASASTKIYNDGTGTKIYRNKGYITENSGTATVASGDTSVTVAHGLGATPSINDISVAPTNDMGNSAKFWVSDVTSSNFNINVDVDPGATTATFSWQVARY